MSENLQLEIREWKIENRQEINERECRWEEADGDDGYPGIQDDHDDGGGSWEVDGKRERE